MKLVKSLLVAGLVLVLGGQLAACGSPAKTEASPSASVSAGTGTGSADSTKDPVTGEAYPDVINIGVIEGGPESAILTQENYFSGIGVKVNAVTYSAGTDINNAIVSGDVDVACFGASPIALGIANNINYKAIFVSYIEGGNIEALAVKNSLGVTDVAGLKGKRIAAPFGTTSHYALLNALKLAGLSAGDVTLLDMGGQDIVAAWQRGDIDAAYIWSPALDEIVKDGNIVINDGKLAEQGVKIPEIGVARTEFAQKYPTLVSQYVKALINTYDLVKTNPEQAAKDVADWEGISTDGAKGQVTDNIWISGEDQLTADYLGTADKKGALAEILKTIADFHADQGNISKAPDVKAFEDAIDPSFVSLALK
ncbi:taurine transport system substrate-binding protein [Sporobacter termitidis DSM 10068]|uniref:Taurine transport system substrate-binding protein n=1 Tax=Sporobacter termitidis DSM 10068 TaxID=1123282 RepID=A0A1M5UTY3_9FIRM|nr:ABC transporter substrate-binding protein [Sporobacter termitidis]SHH66431.1 taurine transport system substrate-binding protein [Sporobacter termitidis DSM 10068]